MRILCLLAALGLQLATGPIMAQGALVSSQVIMSAGESSAAVVIAAGERQAVVHAGLWTATKWSAAAHYLGDVMTEFDRVSPGLRTTPIQVFPSAALGPHVNYPVTMERADHTDIHLATKGNSWSQLAFQFSHEYLHYLLDRPFHEDDPFGWFEETLCEVASLYALHRLPNYHTGDEQVDRYRVHFPDYARLRAQSNPITLSAPTCSFVGTHLDHLTVTRYDREKNLAIAKQLLPLFVEDPSLWAAVPYLRDIDDATCTDFGAYLDAWVATAPDSLRDKVLRLREEIHPDCQPAIDGLALGDLP